MSRHVEAAGVRLWCRELGEGPPLVLLHPGPTLDGEILFPWFERLAATHRLVAPDLPGSGRSSVAPPDLRTIEGYADVVHGLIGELGLERPIVLGHSFGSFVALAYGIRHAGEPAGVVSSCGAASEHVFDDLEDRLAAFEPADLRERAVAAFEREDDVRSTEELRAVWADQLPFFCADPDGRGCRDLVAALERSQPRPMAEDEGPRSYDVRAQLAGLTVPLLAIAGTDDRSTPRAASEEIAALAPRAELRVIERTGHFPYAEDAGAYFSVLEAWLAARD